MDGRVLGALLGVLGMSCAHPQRSSTFERRYPSGQVMVQMEMKDNLPEGTGRRHHPNGELAYEGTYRAGAREGTFHFWDEHGTWLRKELYRGGELVWSTTDRSEHPSIDLASPAAPKANSLLEVEGAETPTFSGMRPLTLRDGVVLQGSYQQIERDNNRSRAQTFLLAAAHDLGFLGQPKLGVYGALGMTSVEFGSQTADALTGKRTLEVGGRWRPTTRGFTIAAGVAVPVGGDTLDGYRADLAGAQLAMDTGVGPYPRSTSLRTHAAYVHQRGAVFYRADAGADLVLDTHGDERLMLTSSSIFLLRAGVAIGFTTQRFLLAGQLRALSPVDTASAVANASLTAEIHSYDLRPGLTLYLPIAGTQSMPGLAASVTYDLD